MMQQVDVVSEVHHINSLIARYDTRNKAQCVNGSRYCHCSELAHALLQPQRALQYFYKDTVHQGVLGMATEYNHHAHHTALLACTVCCTIDGEVHLTQQNMHTTRC